MLAKDKKLELEILNKCGSQHQMIREALSSNKGMNSRYVADFLFSSEILLPMVLDLEPEDRWNHTNSETLVNSNAERLYIKYNAINQLKAMASLNHNHFGGTSYYGQKREYMQLMPYGGFDAPCVFYHD